MFDRSWTTDGLRLANNWRLFEIIESISVTLDIVTNGSDDTTDRLSDTAETADGAEEGNDNLEKDRPGVAAQ